MADFITGDTHARHANIIKYSKRPFRSVQEMDDQLVLNINSTVGEHDTLYHVGDVASHDLEGFLERINCKKIVLIEGNHDRIRSNQRRLFSGIYAMYTIKTEFDGIPTDIVLCHYAMRVWNKSHYGAYHAYGHSHGSLPEDPNARSMDVGVDSIAQKLSPDGVTLRPEDYRPISLLEFHNYMKLKQWKPIDHHRGKHVDTSFVE